MERKTKTNYKDSSVGPEGAPSGKPDKKLTIREQLIRSLEAEPMSARDLSKALRISEKEVYYNLPFIQKSIRHQKKQITITPCSCLSCGFEFKDRKSFKKPGKCPQCRQSRIEPAVFEIIEA